MRLSLRLRLLLAVGLVVLAAVAAVGVLSSRITTVQFHRFQEMEELAGSQPPSRYPEGLAAELAALHGPGGGWEGAAGLLAAAAAGEGDRRAYLLVDPNGNLAAASSPRLDSARVESRGNGTLRLTGGGEAGAETESLELIFKGPGLPVRDADGALLGTVYSIPPLPPRDGATPADRFLLAVNRWLVGAVLAAGALALGITYFLSRRIVAPVEALTRAAGRLERGDLRQRVSVDSRDEIGRLAAAFNSMADGLERIEELRRRLVSDVAHELRTPLTGIRCQLESIQDGVVEPSEEVFAGLHQDVLSLQKLVDDLQDLALAEAGRLALERRAVEVGAEVEAVVRGLVPAGRGGSTPRVSVQLQGLPPADADPLRFRQIMRNLLDNALTHGPAGGTVAVTGRRAAGGTLEITVRDDGPGIDPEDLPHIFDRFYRADPSRQRRTGGAGLGLAIVKQLVEAHGGSVRARSRPGEGAELAITLPAARREPGAGTGEPAG